MSGTGEEKVSLPDPLGTALEVLGKAGQVHTVRSSCAAVLGIMVESTVGLVPTELYYVNAGIGTLLLLSGTFDLLRRILICCAACG